MDSEIPYYTEPRKRLTNDVAVLVLGIVSCVLCGVGLVTSIIALVLSKKPLQAYKENPEMYSEQSYSQMNAGRICAIVGVCLNALVILFYVLYFVFIFSVIAGSAAF